MSDLLDKIYLPELKKKNLINSNAYRFLKENKEDPSILEGYKLDDKIMAATQGIRDFDTFIQEGGTKDDWIAAHAPPELQKEVLSNIGPFIYDTIKDTGVSLGIAAVNGADVATNLMPLIFKVMSKSPIAVGMPEEFFNPQTEEEVYNTAKYISSNLDKAREYLYSFQDDQGLVKDLFGIIVQDLAYSMPAYNYLKKAGVPKYPAFFISSAIGAIGVEDEKDGIKTRFTGETIFAKDLIKLKELLAILPDTPEDQIANEVVQALEYGSFGAVLPGIIDAFKFMKRYIPAMTATGAGSAVMFSDNEAHGSIKNIVNAVNKVPMFKSTVVDAAGNLQSSGTGEQILKTLSNQPGVKLNEIKWMNLDTYLNNRAKDIVTKDEVIDFINANKIDVSEVKLASSQSSNIDSLPRELQEQISDYETRWRDSDLASLEARPNYDIYKFRSTTYASGSAVNQLGEPTQATARAIASETGEDVADNMIDWQSINRSPLIRAMDDDLNLTGDTAEYFDINQYSLKNSPWFDYDTGKFTAHVVDVSEDIEFKVRKKDYTNYVVDDKLRVVVPSATLDTLDGKFTKIAKYELEPLELERFLLEDRSRNFKLNNTDQMPVFEKYTMPGGEEYTELVFKVKNKDNTMPAVLEGEFGTLKGNKVKATQKTSIDYLSPHFSKMNEFAHVRFKTRYLPNGKKVLTVEEMQSDLLQASKTQLFVSSKAETTFGTEKVLKDFPFKNTWYEFTIKRLTRYAADNGFDAIAIPKGSIAANRYGQEIKNLKKIEIRPMEINKDIKRDEAGYLLSLFDDKGSMYKTKSIFGVPGDDGFFEGMQKLEKDVGSNNFAEIQTLLLQADDTQNVVTKVFDEAQVTGSGVGKFNLYDKTIPAYMKKYAKKWNAKVYDNIIETGSSNIDGNEVKIPVTVLEFSKEMRKEITTNSQPLFSFLGGVSLSTWGAKEIKDNMENNIISQSTY